MKRLLLVLLMHASILLVSCSTDANDHLDMAADALKNDNVSEAIGHYETIIADHKDSKAYPIALFELGRIYQGRLANNISAENSVKKSMYYFQKVVNEFSEHEKAPSSLFMIGFIQANELNDYESASESYQLFLERYPEHELAASAQEEIDIMGLDPDEILRSKLDGQITSEDELPKGSSVK